MASDFEKLFERFKGKRALVMGLGLMGGGVESARFLHRHGAKVLATDLRDARTLAPSIDALKDIPVEYRLGEHLEQDFKNAEVVIHSPAVRPDHKLLELARVNGAEVTQEMSLFIEACPALTVGITGSNGKTTTAAMCYEMLRERLEAAQPDLSTRWADNAPPEESSLWTSAPPRTGRLWLGGNIGTPLINRLDEMAGNDVVVLELSSFQLMDWHRIERSCHVGLITNVTPNHLDWHTDVDEYIRAKTAVFDYAPNRVAIVNTNDVVTSQIGHYLEPQRRRWFDPTGERWVKEMGWEFERRSCLAAIFGPMMMVPLHPDFQVSDEAADTPHRDDLRLAGQFNWWNAAAAAAAASSALPMKNSWLRRALRRFRGVEHRLEPCGEIRGAKIYNDSIATDPAATMAALGVFESGIHLIAGGASDKGAGYDKLARVIVEHGGIKGLYLQGPTANAIRQAIARADARRQDQKTGTGKLPPLPPLLDFPSFEHACRAALAAARQGDVVLMSPASTSFYEHSPGLKFANFEDRGKFFKELVRSQSAKS